MKSSKIWLQYTALTAACLLCYGTTILGSDFVFDDSVAIVRNPDVYLASATLTQIFQHDFWGFNLSDPTSHKSYRPLTILSFRWETHWLLAGSLNACYMKMGNLFLHIVVSCLLLKFYKQLVSGSWSSFAAALLFAVHPIHTEAVAGCVGRAELLCSIFYLIGIFCFLQLSKKRPTNAKHSYVFFMATFGLLVVCTILALLCKETGITIMPLCMTYDVIANTNVMQLLTRKTNKLQTFDKQIICRCFLLTIATGTLIYLRLWIMNFEGPTFKAMDNPIAAASSQVTRIVNQQFLYSLNLWLLLCPDWLSFDWALGSIRLIETVGDIRLTSILCFYILFILLILYGTRRSYIAIALMVVPFLPASGIVRLGFVIAERILYIPSMGFCLLIAIGLEKMSKYFARTKEIFYTLFGLLVALMILKTRSRANDWTNEELLFRSALRVCPNNAKVYYNIAKLMADKNDRSTARQYYHKAISLYPDYEAALMNLGNLYRDAGQLDVAEMYLKRSIELLEEFPAAWMNLGIVLASRGKYNESLHSYRQALRYRRNYATCYYNMGNLFIEMHNKSMALKSWQEAVTIEPQHSKAWANLLAFMDNNGQHQQVLDLSSIALQHVPNDSAILFTRANAFGKLNRYEEAEAVYLRIVHQKPVNALYFVNLGVLYHRWNRADEAISAYEQALALDASHTSARENLHKLLRKKNRLKIK